MALFNHLFPYSNLHDINLDWIISIIKSIDPAVIQALQELTPDIIEQVNQKVAEAQAFAVSAQSSASEASTAKENATTSATEAARDAALANADAVRAENAANVVANALTPQIISPTFADFLAISSGVSWVSGKIMHISAYGTINSVPESPAYPTIVTFPADKKIIAGQTGSFFVKSGNTVSDMIACGSSAEKVDITRGTLVQGAMFMMICDFVLQ